MATMETVTFALLVSALIIVIGFLGSFFFERTGVPDMLLLISLGLFVGPILNIVDPLSVGGLAPYISALALVFILFDGGMSMNIRQVVSHSLRAVLLAVLGFLFSTSVIALVMILWFEVALPYALLFGSIYGGSSSIVVVSLASRLNVSEKCSTTLILESATTDILCVVVSLAIIGIIMTGQADFEVVGFGLVGKFGIGAVLGVISGVGWSFILKRVSTISYSYMLTLAVLLFAYAVSEWLGGSGALSSLLFGITLGNEKNVSEVLRNKRVTNIVEPSSFRRFESEIAFLMRTFFFVFLGIIASISDIDFIFLGVFLSILLLAVRSSAVWLTTIRCELKRERQIMTVVLTRGLAAAVLATLPIQYGLLYSDVFINLAVVIIIFTAIFATVGVLVISHRKVA